MLFSCKISHSIINHLDRRGEDLTNLDETCDWPVEFLRDPSSWLEAPKMEEFLADFVRNPAFRQDEDLLMAAGHASKDLRAWGALDSVLRMVQAPKDLFGQPDRFLSYFISPAPPIGDIQRRSDSISFVLPISEEQYPHVTRYLRAALEALPSYIGKPMAQVKWEESRVTIAWTESQESLFSEDQSSELSLHPELIQNILLNLEASQKELEETKKKLVAKEKEATRILPTTLAQTDLEVLTSVESALHELYRLGDYFARGQQLVTLLVAQGRQTPQVTEAMRRVDWNFVCEAAPNLIKKTIQELQDAQGCLRQGADALSTSPQPADGVQKPLPGFQERKTLLP